MILMKKMMTKHYILGVPNFEPRPQLLSRVRPMTGPAGLVAKRAALERRETRGRTRSSAA